jgi:flavin reductase (DIM6/NTAB) family NADH-FMN oxidoreductase RutF/DNA-binding MarR family transcriptional regulator
MTTNKIDTGQATANKSADDIIRSLRRCFGQYATGVTVVTTTVDGIPYGVTANSFSSLSLTPPLIQWAIAKSSRSYSAFKKASHFAVNILTSNQITISQIFASSSADRFGQVTWEAGHHGSPILPGTAAIIECKVHQLYDAGDHMLMIGEVERFSHGDEQPLIFLQGRYCTAQEHPGLKSESASAPALREQERHELAITTLLFRAHHMTSLAFESHRKAEGLSTEQSRTLVFLSEQPVRSVQELADGVFTRHEEAHDTISELTEMGLVARGADGLISLTEKGVAKREAVRHRGIKLEEEHLAGFTDQEVVSIRSFLAEWIRRVERSRRREH